MSIRKKTLKYYFSVEGQTEKWYLDWLEKLINNTNESLYKVKLDSRVEKSPFRRAKNLNITDKTEIWHLSDYESNEDLHVKRFYQTIDELDKVNKIGKQINYKFGYSNYTFDLWLILHKIDYNGSQTDRANYLYGINKAYNEKFLSMKDYKRFDNFHKCLNQLDLSNVREAIKHSKVIIENNRKNITRLWLNIITNIIRNR
jgi:hypothetical protein